MIRKDTIKKQLSRKYYSESKKRRYFKEGAGAGVLLQVSEFKGTLTDIKDGGKDCDCILHLEECWMDGCSICTYYWCSPEWFDGYFNNGTVDLYINFTDAINEDEIKENINAIEIGQKIDDEDFTISHGGGWSHQSLKDKASGEVFDGKVSEWRNNHPHSIGVKDKDGYYIECEIENIVFDFGDQIEEVYQAVEGLYLEDDEEEDDDMNENYKKSSAITKRIKQYKENMMDDRESDSLSVSAIDAIIKEIRSKYEDMFDTISTRGNEIVLHLNNADAELHITTSGNNCDAYLVTFLNNKKVETKRDIQRYVNDVIKTVEDTIK